MISIINTYLAFLCKTFWASGWYSRASFKSLLLKTNKLEYPWDLFVMQILDFARILHIERTWLFASVTWHLPFFGSLHQQPTNWFLQRRCLRSRWPKLCHYSVRSWLELGLVWRCTSLSLLLPNDRNETLVSTNHWMHNEGCKVQTFLQTKSPGRKRTGFNFSTCFKISWNC